MTKFSENSVFFTIIFLVYVTNNANAIRTKDKMYQSVAASRACFRRLNATHQIGCSSERGGSTGAVHYCTTQADLDFILKNGTAPPYIPIIPTKLFTQSNINALRNSAKIAGLLVYPASTPPEHFSHEQQCPNPTSSIRGSCPAGGWNPLGTGLLHQDIPFPIFYVETEDALSFVKQCFEKHNNFSFGTQRDRSLCSLQLISFMFATTNSATCIRRSNHVTNLNPVRFCDPLGDRNAWASLFPLVSGPNLTEPIRDASYIIVAARIDTTSVFDKTEGAIAPVTGLVALLATAKYLKTILPKLESNSKNVLFVVFNGESFDYLGSQRFVYELLKGNFPTKSKDYLPDIRMEDIDLYVELSQLNRTDLVVAHHTSSQVKNFLLKLQTNRGGLNLTDVEDSLPPASMHSFVRNRTDFPGVILADHVRQFANRYYNSLYDNATNLGYQYLNLTEGSVELGDNIQTHIQRVASMLGKSLYLELAGKSYTGTEDADLQFVDELFHCYLENANCRVHRAVQKNELQKQPWSLYVGVSGAHNYLTTFVGLTLGWVTADVVGKGDRNCSNEPTNYAFHNYNMSKSLDDLNTTLCYRITMNLTEAVSPAFIIDDYDWSSGQYSTWTESVWGEIRLRIFLKPSAAHETMTIALGSMVFIFSLLFVYFVKSRSDILFPPQLPPLSPTSC